MHHHTSDTAADDIVADRTWHSQENGWVYFTTLHTGAADGYGPACVTVTVPLEWCELDDEWTEDGAVIERHYRIRDHRLNHWPAALCVGSSLVATPALTGTINT